MSPVMKRNVQCAVPSPTAEPGWYHGLVKRVKELKREVLALYYAAHDPRVGCTPRALSLVAIGCVKWRPPCLHPLASVMCCAATV